MPRDCSQLHLVKRDGDDAMLKAAARADQLLVGAKKLIEKSGDEINPRDGRWWKR
jgi:hypothetical protein